MTLKVNTGIILSVDHVAAFKAKEIIKRVSPHVDVVKLGWNLLGAYGLQLVPELKAESVAPIMLDLKLGDVPETVTHLVFDAHMVGASAITLQGFAGSDMLRACIEEADKYEINTFVVSELSSPGGLEFMARASDDIILLAKSLGATGVTAPATHHGKIQRARLLVDDKMQIMATGIGIQGPNVGMGIYEGADFEVIGRKITQEDDPVGMAQWAAERIRQER